MTSSAEGPLARRRVLVVEDEYFIADDLARALEKLGAEVLGPVPTKDQAIKLLSSRQAIDAAVLDVNLRGADVFSVADALMQRGVPVVFATGYEQAVIPVAYKGLPRWEKPFDADQLAQALPRVIDKH